MVIKQYASKSNLKKIPVMPASLNVNPGLLQHKAAMLSAPSKIHSSMSRHCHLLAINV